MAKELKTKRSSDMTALHKWFPTVHQSCFCQFSTSPSDTSSRSPGIPALKIGCRRRTVISARRPLFGYLLCFLFLSSPLFASALPDPSLSVTIPSLSGRFVESSLLLPHHFFTLQWNTIAFYPSSSIELYVIPTDLLPLTESILSAYQQPSRYNHLPQRPSAPRRLEPSEFNWDKLVHTFHDIFVETGLSEHDQAVLLTFLIQIDAEQAEKLLLNMSPSSSAALASSLSLPPTDIGPLLLDPPQLKSYVLEHLNPPSDVADSFNSSLSNIASSMPNPYSAADSVNSLPPVLLSQFFASVTRMMAASGGTNTTPLGDLASLFSSLSSMAFAPSAQEPDVEPGKPSPTDLPPAINVQPPIPEVPATTDRPLSPSNSTPSSGQSIPSSSIPLLPSSSPSAKKRPSSQDSLSTSYQSIADIAVFSALIPNSGTAVLSAFITPAPQPAIPNASTTTTTIPPFSSTTTSTSFTSITILPPPSYTTIVAIPEPLPTDSPVPSGPSVSTAPVHKDDVSLLVDPSLPAFEPPSITSPSFPPSESPPPDFSFGPIELAKAVISVSSALLPLADKLSESSKSSAAKQPDTVVGEGGAEDVRPTDETVDGQGSHISEGMDSRLNSLLGDLNQIFDKPVSILIGSSKEKSDKPSSLNDRDEGVSTGPSNDSENAIAEAPRVSTALGSLLSNDALKPPMMEPQWTLPLLQSSGGLTRPMVRLSAESPSLLHPLILYPASPVSPVESPGGVHPMHPSLRALASLGPERSQLSSYTVLLLSPQAAWRSSPPIAAISPPIRIAQEPSPDVPLVILSPTQYLYPREPTTGGGTVAVAGTDKEGIEKNRVMLSKEPMKEGQAESRGYRVVPLTWATHEGYIGDFSLSIWQTDPLSVSFSSLVLDVSHLSSPAAAFHSLQLLFPLTSCQS
eukprot:GHVS01052873.1.p1 GENE.GHVS01052873.1~~GHVS01052873.1.p1  ORF type:complete len:910 (+),score=132.16 GHVS01052873.1:100-2829(+)